EVRGHESAAPSGWQPPESARIRSFSPGDVQRGSSAAGATGRPGWGRSCARLPSKGSRTFLDGYSTDAPSLQLRKVERSRASEAACVRPPHSPLSETGGEVLEAVGE